MGQGLKQRAPSRGPEPSDLGELPFPEPSDLGELPFSDLPGREDPPTQPEPSYEMTPTNHIVYIKGVGTGLPENMGAGHSRALVM